MQQWLFLFAAILSEVIATSALKASAGFTYLWPSVIVVAGYTAAFYLLALVLKTIPMGVAYAIWSGAGIALITLIGWLFFKQSLNLPGLIGIGFIIAGVIILQLFSTTLPDA